MTTKWLAVLIAAVMVVPSGAQFRPGHRFTLSADYLKQAIVKALLEQGVEIKAVQVSLTGEVLANAPDPTFDVHSAGLLQKTSPGNPDARFAVKLTCHTADQCMPFFAIVTRPAQAGPLEVGMLHAAPVPAIAKKAAAPIVMRSGARATLFMDDDRAHIKMSVISLENGPTGRTIRVQSADRKRIYSAEIVGPNTLRGSF